MEVRWSPNHEDKFYSFGTNLGLYKVNDITDENVAWVEGGSVLSERTYATLLSLSTDVPYRCIAWFPSRSPDHLIAAGQPNGRVLLTTFGKGGTPDSRSLLGKEFVPRHQRPCLFLEWNPVETHLLAEVLERYRQDHSILIWDVRSSPTSDISLVPERKSSTASADGVCVSRPVHELCSSEIVTSLAWFPREAKTLVTAVANKYLKIFDIRDPTRPANTLSTKSLYGLTFDKHHDYQLASFHENIVSVWDIRNFEKPVINLQESRPVSKLLWNPTRAGLLACLNRDSYLIKLYDIQLVSFSDVQKVGETHELCITERVLKPRIRSEGTTSMAVTSSGMISSFDWHPLHTNRLLAIGYSGTLADIFLHERLAICWSPDVYLTWADGQQLHQYHTVKMSKESSEDIGSKMRRRALKGYGLTENINEIINKHIRGDKQLRQLWKWICMVNNLQDDPEIILPAAFRHTSGVQAILKTAASRSDVVDLWPAQSVESFRSSATKRIYRSEERKYAMIFCGWSANRDSPSMPIIDSLEDGHEFERAAAIAVFSLKVTRAIEVLKSGANWRCTHASPDASCSTDLNIIAMAISGFTADDRNQLWREQCRSLGCSLAHPYFRAMFAFLTSNGSEAYDDILNDSQLELEDRVAFACLYLPEGKLHEFIDGQTIKCIKGGNLAGIFLTGLSSDGISLMQQYVDKTADVQTAAVAAIHCIAEPDQSKDHRIVSWIIAYCDLLDVWRLWHQRAEFDIFRCRSSRTVIEPDPQVLVSCNFCSKPISADGVTTVSRFTRKPFGVTSPTPPSLAKLKATCCTQCRKPLPRCSLCLLHLSTSVGTVNPARMKALAGTGQKISKVSEWMTWCQTCRHGGHAAHVTDWFRDHTECPVSGCNCKCMSLDPVANAVVELDMSPQSASS